MLFRDGSIAILLAVVMVAAAGQAFEMGRPWLRRVVAWLLTLVLYKPVAAMIYAVGLEASASGSSAGAQGVLVGISWMVLAVLALPAMFKFFTWSYDQSSAAYNGGGGLSRALSGIPRLGPGGSGSGQASGGGQGQSPAQQQASRMATPSTPKPPELRGGNPYSAPAAGSSQAARASSAAGGISRAAPAFAVAGAVVGAASAGARRVSAAGGEQSAS
jgi:hypothetical protein